MCLQHLDPISVGKSFKRKHPDVSCDYDQFLQSSLENVGIILLMLKLASEKVETPVVLDCRKLRKRKVL